LTLSRPCATASSRWTTGDRGDIRDACADLRAGDHLVLIDEELAAPVAAVRESACR